MNSAATIASGAPSHNGLAPLHVSPLRLRRSLPLLLATIVLSGCLPHRPAPVAVPAWELARADASTPVLLARARSHPDHPLPARLLDELSPEFSLITVANPADWAEVRRRLDLPPSRVAVDFSKGLVIGIQANVGQRAGPGWPIRLLAIRKRSGEGRIEASFAPGLYYPLETAGYIELTYAPGLHHVNMVCIDSRTFLIGPSAPRNPLEP